MKYSVIADALFLPFRRSMQNVERTFAQSGEKIAKRMNITKHRVPSLSGIFSMSDLSIFCDNAIEANWFKALHPQFAKAGVTTIKQRGGNPPLIDDLISYDRPDIILVEGETPILVIEKTREVPTGHNVGQRVARLVRAVELSIPTIKFFPFDAKKHGKYAAICRLNARLLLAFERMWEIHDTPIVAINWIADKHGELISDGTEDDEMKALMKQFVSSGFDGHASFAQTRKNMLREYEKRIDQKKQYAAPPPSVTFEKTTSFFASREKLLSPQQLRALRAKDGSVIYKMVMTEEKCRREDPYTGTQFIYDYIYCRKGKSPASKSKNLILHFPAIRKEVWEKKNPDDRSRKSCNWYLTANCLVFKDGCIYLR
ncbi:MAG: hypothetical protein P4M15_00590 [Alphaproteobacteria bacterium]|nr:hypothetical protein [Alphaproteobacteria bacterium]